MKHDATRSVKAKKLRLRQITPDGPDAPFTVVEPCNLSWYHVKIQDVIDDCGPEFVKVFKHKVPALRDIAVVGARELTEGRGLLTITRYVQGIPVLSAIFVCNPKWTGWAACIWSTDQTEAPMVRLDPPLCLAPGFFR